MKLLIQERQRARDHNKQLVLDAVLRMRTHKGMIHPHLARHLLVPHVPVAAVLDEDQRT